MSDVCPQDRERDDRVGPCDCVLGFVAVGALGGCRVVVLFQVIIGTPPLPVRLLTGLLGGGRRSGMPDCEWAGYNLADDLCVAVQIICKLVFCRRVAHARPGYLVCQDLRPCDAPWFPWLAQRAGCLRSRCFS